jgi:hypothetical protein
VHHFGVVGIANGLSIMADKETHTLWDHISGEAFEGPLKGKFLETWPVFITNMDSEASNHPDTQLFSSNFRSPLMWMISLFTGLMGIYKGGFIPPNFYRSMSKPIDPRLPKLTQGLGVIVGKRAKYYPMDQILRGESITDNWGRRIMTIDRSGTDGIPRAIWKNTGEIPMQLLSRWYGFAFTYPNCEIYKYEKEKA